VGKQRSLVSLETWCSWRIVAPAGRRRSSDRFDKIRENSSIRRSGAASKPGDDAHLVSLPAPLVRQDGDEPPAPPAAPGENWGGRPRAAGRRAIEVSACTQPTPPSIRLVRRSRTSAGGVAKWATLPGNQQHACRHGGNAMGRSGPPHSRIAAPARPGSEKLAAEIPPLAATPRRSVCWAAKNGVRGPVMVLAQAPSYRNLLPAERSDRRYIISHTAQHRLPTPWGFCRRLPSAAARANQRALETRSQSWPLPRRGRPPEIGAVRQIGERSRRFPPRPGGEIRRSPWS